MDHFAVVGSLCGMAVLGWVFWWKFRSIISPPSMHLLSFLAVLTLYWLLNQLKDFLDLHVDLVGNLDNVAVTYLLASYGFALAWIGPVRSAPWLLINSASRSVFELPNVRLWVLVEMLGVVSLLLLVGMSVGLPIAGMFGGTLDIWQAHAQLAELPLGVLALNTLLVQLMALQLATLFVHQNYHKNVGGWLVMLLLMIVIASVWQAKRQLLLFAAFVCLIAAFSDIAPKRHRFRQLMSVAALLGGTWALFVFVQLVRIGPSESSPYWAEIFVAVVWPLLNLSRVIEDITPSGELLALLSQLVPHRFLGHGIEDVQEILFEPTASMSYVQYAYMDFGYLGVFLAAFVFGITARLISTIAPNTLLAQQAKLLVLWVCATAAIYPHPFSLNFFVAPALALWLLGKLFGYRALSRHGMALTSRSTEGAARSAPAQVRNVQTS